MRRLLWDWWPLPAVLLAGALLWWSGREPNYRPLPVADLPALDMSDGQTRSLALLPGDRRLWYFTASWCGPCHRFTPELLQRWQAAGEAAPPVVLVSLDEDPQAWAAYRRQLPWPSVPLADGAGDQLAAAVGLRGIPFLVLTDREGQVLDTSWSGGPHGLLDRTFTDG